MSESHKRPEGECLWLNSLVKDMSRMDQKQRKDTVNEAKVLSSLKHPYVVPGTRTIPVLSEHLRVLV